MADNKVGVEMVVSGLSSFLGDLNKADKGIQSLIPTSGLLGSAFSALGSIAEGVSSFIANTLAHAIGELLADAVEWAISKFNELVEASIEIGNQFQSLEIRLNQMNFNVAVDGAKDYETAMQQAKDATKEQLDWITKLAFVTPFESKDIVDVYGMARAFSFADEDARALTETVADFASGMGLGGVEMKAIIRQFGQAQNQGKLLQRDLNALAQGGMVPVVKIMELMGEKTGKSKEELSAFMKTGEGVQMFLETFTGFVENNYAGAAEKANRTFKYSTITLKEYLSTLAGINVIKPILDVIGTRVAEINDALQSKMPQIADAFSRIGQRATEIIDILFGKFSIDSFADGLVSALTGIADWLDAHRDDIAKWIDNAIKWIGDALPKIAEVVMSIISVLPPLLDLLKALGGVIAAVFGSKEPVSFAEFVSGTLIPAITQLTTWIRDNTDTIAKWIVFFGKLAIVIEVGKWFLGLMFAIVGAIATIIVSIGLFITGITAAIAAIAALPTIAIIAIAAFVGAIIAGLTALGGFIVGWIASKIGLFGSLKNAILSTFTSLPQQLYSLGVSMIMGFASGIYNAMPWVIQAAVTAATSAVNAVKNILKSKSPSKVFMEIGQNTMEGMAIGIENMAGVASGAMQSAVGKMVMPAMNAPAMAYSAASSPTTNNSYQTTNQYNLNINSSANTEPIVQDFAMMSSLAGV